jgi:NTE family protein
LSVESRRADLVLAGGGVKGIGHVGAVAALREAGYTFPRVAGTSAGSVVGALVAAGMTSERMSDVMEGLSWQRFRDPGLIDRVPFLGPAASILLEYGIYEGDYVREWLGDQLEDLGVRTFRDLRIWDPEGSLEPEESYKLVVMATDITRGELVRLPWDYARYGLDPDDVLVADAVRASISIPIFFEPVTLRHADGTSSTLVDGGVLSNYPIDVFDRTDGELPRWPTFGVTLLPRLPAGNVQLFPWLGRLGRGLPHYVECLVTTTVVGRDQAYLARPWVQARTIDVDASAVGVVEFDVDERGRAALYASGHEAASEFLERWDFDAYKRRFRCVPPNGQGGRG